MTPRVYRLDEPDPAAPDGCPFHAVDPGDTVLVQRGDRPLPYSGELACQRWHASAAVGRLVDQGWSELLAAVRDPAPAPTVYGLPVRVDDTMAPGVIRMVGADVPCTAADRADAPAVQATIASILAGPPPRLRWAPGVDPLPDRGDGGQVRRLQRFLDVEQPRAHAAVDGHLSDAMAGLNAQIESAIRDRLGMAPPPPNPTAADILADIERARDLIDAAGVRPELGPVELSTDPPDWSAGSVRMTATSELRWVRVDDDRSDPAP